MIDLVNICLDPYGLPVPEVMEAAETLTGAPVNDLTVIRHGTNLVLGSASAEIILRVTPADRRDLIKKNCRLVADLAARGVPVVPPITTEVVATEHWCATAWNRYDTASDIDWREVGAVLSHLHRATPDDCLGDLDVVGMLHTNMRQIPDDVPESVVRSAGHLVDDAVNAVGSLNEFPRAMIHADFYDTNIVATPEGVRLIDLDSLTLGDPAYDLASLRAFYHRLDRDHRRWEAFLDGYDLAVDWNAVKAYTVAREVIMITWMISRWNRGDSWRAEVMHRLNTVRLPWRDHAPWAVV